MVRTQIQLSDRQARQVKREARDRGISMAAVVRECLDRALSPAVPDRAALYDRAAAVIGRFRDHEGARDLGRDHDRYLDEAYR